MLFLRSRERRSSLSTEDRLTAVILIAVTDSDSLMASYLMGRDELTSCPGCYVQSSEEAITKAGRATA